MQREYIELKQKFSAMDYKNWSNSENPPLGNYDMWNTPLATEWAKLLVKMDSTETEHNNVVAEVDDPNDGCMGIGDFDFSGIFDHMEELNLGCAEPYYRIKSTVAGGGRKVILPLWKPKLYEPEVQNNDCNGWPQFSTTHNGDNANNGTEVPILRSQGNPAVGGSGGSDMEGLELSTGNKSAFAIYDRKDLGQSKCTSSSKSSSGSYNSGFRGTFGYMWQKKHYEDGSGCSFCLKCTEALLTGTWKTHVLRSEGKVICPKLRSIVCEICKATGDFAHTIGYCPYASEFDRAMVKSHHRILSRKRGNAFGDHYYSSPIHSRKY